MNIKLIIFLIFPLLNSCNKAESNEIDNTKIEYYKNWDELEIQTGFETLRISKFSDSAEFEKIIYNDGIYDIPPTYKNKRVELKKIYFSKVERDSLSKLIYYSVTKPKFTDILATDNVGNVKLKFRKENMNLICEYKSVGNWTEVSDTTKKIYDLISKKVKISQQ